MMQFYVKPQLKTTTTKAKAALSAFSPEALSKTANWIQLYGNISLQKLPVSQKSFQKETLHFMIIQTIGLVRI